MILTGTLGLYLEVKFIAVVYWASCATSNDSIRRAFSLFGTAIHSQLPIFQLCIAKTIPGFLGLLPTAIILLHVDVLGLPLHRNLAFVL